VTGSCPKHMVMGPCGGVRADGGCEVVPHPCVFPDPVPWAEPVPVVPLRAVPLILADFSSEPFSVPAHRTVAAALAPSCDAVLVGEHQNRPDFPPVLLASILQDAGTQPSSRATASAGCSARASSPPRSSCCAESEGCP
jgi:Methylene-tetrahydrofolate reductase C terminal